MEHLNSFCTIAMDQLASQSNHILSLRVSCPLFAGLLFGPSSNIELALRSYIPTIFTRMLVDFGIDTLEVYELTTALITEPKPIENRK